MNKLFNEKRIEEYFFQIEKGLMSEINLYPESDLITLDVNKMTETLIEKYNLTIPIINKQNITTSIKAEKISGSDLPPNMMIEKRAMYDVEYANYTVPFTGNNEIFKCFPTIGYDGVNVSVLSDKYFLIKLTNYNIISGNDKAIEELRNNFLMIINKIEQILIALKNDIDRLKPELYIKIKCNLEEKIKQTKNRIESNSKLNPFQ